MSKVFCTLISLLYLSAVPGQSIDSIPRVSFLKDTNLTYAPDSIYFHYFNSNSFSWENGWKDIFKYPNPGLKSSETNYTWTNEGWQPNHQTTYSYIDNKLAQYQFSEWDDYEFEWVPRGKYSYTYNSQGNITQLLDSKWNVSLLTWMDDSIMLYNYNESGLLTSQYVNIWSTYFNVWENNSEILFDYAEGYNTRQVFSFWDFDQLIWDSRRILYITYDANQAMVSQMQTVINSYHTQWLNDWKKEYKWNSYNQIQEETSWDWAKDDSSWSETYKTKYIYDNRNNLIEKVAMYYDAYYLDWRNQYQTINIFSTSNKLIESTFYYWNYGQWNPLYMYNYYYPDYTGLSDKQVYQLQVFPNPATDKLFIHFFYMLQGNVDIYLYDISGKQVYNHQIQIINADIEMPLPYLPNGLYLIKIVYSNQIEIRKVIIQYD